MSSHPDSEIVELPVKLLRANLDMIDQAAMALGESRVDAINRACALYFRLHDAVPVTEMTWKIGPDARRTIRIIE